MELEVLRESVREMFETPNIRDSKSPVAGPILFVPKAHMAEVYYCASSTAE
jgi:hypothetical protein